MTSDTQTAEYLCDAALDALPKIKHGFFTRNGGVSEGIYASLNVGVGSDDDANHVAENRRRVAAAMGITLEQLVTLYQIHSKRVVAVDTPFSGTPPEADGLVTATPGLALGVLTADCAPVLLADAEAKVIGACHAGWKGAMLNIMEHTVQKMEALGAARERIVATVGPCIAQASYEVDEGFYKMLMANSAINGRFLAPSAARAGHYHFDLPAYVHYALEECGIAHANVLANDTCFQENTFFSNRRRNLRGESDYGRQISVIMLEP